MSASQINASYQAASVIGTWAQQLALAATGNAPDVISVLANNAANKNQVSDYAIAINALQQIAKINPNDVTVPQIQQFAKLILNKTVGV
jgi:hypothetical protein